MFSRRNLGILASAILLAVVGVQVVSSDDVWVDLAPIPYEMKVPADIAERITVEDQAGDKGEGFMKQAFDDGAIGVVALSYQPVKGEKTWFMGAYYFVEADLDKTSNPDEVPPYGFKLLARDGMALSVVGPQESIYEPMSQDGKNITKLYDILYEAKSYRFVG